MGVVPAWQGFSICLESIQLLIPYVCGPLLLGIKLSEHDAEHLPPFGAKIKNER